MAGSSFNIGYSKPGYTISVNGVRRNAFAPVPTNVSALPPAGKAADLLVKFTDKDFDAVWMSLDTLTNAMRSDDGNFLLNDDGSIILKEIPPIT